MQHNEILAPCSRCRTVDLLRPYGCQDAMICIDCARELNEPSAAVTELAEEASAILRRIGR